MATQIKLTEFQSIKQDRDKEIIRLYRSMKGAKTAIYSEIAEVIEPKCSASCVQKVIDKYEKGLANVPCPVCDGTGTLHDEPCSYAKHEEPDCEKCHRVNCGYVEVCDGCEGRGEVSERDARLILNGMEV